MEHTSAKRRPERPRGPPRPGVSNFFSSFHGSGYNPNYMEVRPGRHRARNVLAWPKRRKLAHAFLREFSHKRLELAQLPGQLGALSTMPHALSCQARTPS